MHGSIGQRSLRANPGSVPKVHGVTEPYISSWEARKRERGVPSIEVIAIAALRRHWYERRSGQDARICRFDRDGGRTSARSSARYDARIVRKVDFERCLESIGGFNASILKLFYVDGETMAVTAASVAASETTLHLAMPQARRALAAALEAAALI